MSSIRRFLFRVQYLGTDFVGWQKQATGPSIQGTLEDIFSNLFSGKIAVKGSGRTDAGVHALGQMFHVDLNTHLAPKAIREMVNQKLPRSIFLTHSWEVIPEFHALNSAIGKHYRYLIHQAARRSPFFEDRAWLWTYPLDVEAMKRAARDFVGIHDFASFRAADSSAKTSVREVRNITVRTHKSWIVIDVEGKGFLKNMVRAMVGTLVDIGIKRIGDTEIPRILKACDRTKAGRTAPAHGLYLVSVTYPPSKTWRKSSPPERLSR